MNLKGTLKLLLAGTACCLLAGPASALIILTPDDMTAVNYDPPNTNEPDVFVDGGLITDTEGLELLYKAEAGTGNEAGSFAGSYQTTFSNTAEDPQDALIEWIVDTAAIECPECYLAVKDGNADPTYYVVNLGSWDGMESISLQGFWPEQGAISHISIWGREDDGGPGSGNPVPEPSSLLLLSTGLLGLWGLRRRQSDA